MAFLFQTTNVVNTVRVPTPSKKYTRYEMSLKDATLPKKLPREKQTRASRVITYHLSI